MLLRETHLEPVERIALAVDTSEIRRATQLMQRAKHAGALVVKIGLELSSATSWKDCASMADWAGLEWIADAKIDDIPTTTNAAVNNLLNLKHPPTAITVHAKSGIASMKAAQEATWGTETTLFAVTHLTSIKDDETMTSYGMAATELVQNLARSAAEAEIGGLVCSARELPFIKSDSATAGLLTLVPGTRSIGVDVNDQIRVTTPEHAITEGADLLVVGRQITGTLAISMAYLDIANEIKAGLATRGEA